MARDLTPSVRPVDRLQDGSEAGTWRLDASRSRIELHNRHFWSLITVHGRFNLFEGALTADPSGQVTSELKVDAASLDSGMKNRDLHLRFEDFFDAGSGPA